MSTFAAAATSAAVPEAGRTSERFSEMPAFARGAASRIRSKPLACARSKWCAAVTAFASSLMPGAWRPSRWPTNAATQGSLIVIHRSTRSPRRRTTTDV